MADQISIDLVVKFRGGDADRHRIDMYDGAASLFGLSKTLMIASHFLLNEKIIFQAPAAKGVKCYLRTSQPGSLEQIIQIVLDADMMSAITAGAAGAAGGAAKDIAKDFIKFVLVRGVGQPFRAGTRHVRDLLRRKEPEVDVLREATEGGLKDAHRTIVSARTTTQVVAEDKPLVTFNEATKLYVTERILEERTREVRGTISSYNLNSRRGRVFDHELGHTVPFILARDISGDARTTITWSLDNRNRREDADVLLTVSREITTTGEIKRYVVHHAKPA